MSFLSQKQLTFYLKMVAKKQAYYFWLFNESSCLNIFRNSSSWARLIESLKMTCARSFAWILHFMLNNTLKNSTSRKFLAGQIEPMLSRGMKLFNFRVVHETSHSSSFSDRILNTWYLNSWQWNLLKKFLSATNYRLVESIYNVVGCLHSIVV